MSMPIERTIAVLSARVFLHDISCNASFPLEVREHARGLLRHFPSAEDILQLARKEAYFQVQQSTQRLFAVDHPDFAEQLRQLLDADKVIRT